MKSLRVLQATLVTTATTATIVAMSAISALAVSGRISSMGEVNVRSQPSTASGVIAYVYNGQSIDIQSEQINRQDGYGWYRVRLGNQSAMGWIRADFVSYGSGVPTVPMNPGTGGPIERGDLVQFRASQGNRLISVRANPSLDARVKFSGQTSDQVRVEQVVSNREGEWLLISYPNALRSVDSNGWVRSDQVR